MRVVGYCRVSTSEQASEGVSLEMQAKKIEAYCLVKDWQLSEVITDAGESAKSLDRPGMQRLVKMVEAGEISTVIVHKLDRLTRSVADLDRLVKLFEKKGVALVSLQESLDATTATGRLMMNLLASVSQWEREVIGERTKDVMQHLRRTGQVYSRPCLTKGAVISRMQQLRAEGMAYRGIAAQLAADGHQTARGGQWDESTVRKFLARGTQHA
jgi:DNA invertase Pin-like site-specific DNA recombinase